MSPEDRQLAGSAALYILQIAFALLCCLFVRSLPLLAAPQAPSLDRPITDEIFYFVMTDRFADGDPSNNWGGEKPGTGSKEDVQRHGFEPTQESLYHGGDLRGIAGKLDYLQGLGVTAIWLSPVMKNRSTQPGEGTYGTIAGYHGYWPLDFTQVDPHLGTEEDFKNLIASAHKKGMKVFIDVIVNHTADGISYRECQDCPYRSRAEFPTSGTRLGKKLNPGFIEGDLSAANFARLKNPDYAYTPFIPNPKLKKVPAWLNDPIYYHNRGNSTFSGENSEWGDFFGLDDLYTENPRVLAGMIDIYADWIKKYKFDGFRVDTVKHVNIEFWQSFVPAMHEAARTAGIKNFFIFGEVFTGDVSLLSYYTRQGKMDAVLDFAIQGGIKDVFGEGQPKEKLEQILSQDDLHRLGSAPQKMFSFLSNHDIGRFAYAVKNKFKEASDQDVLQRLTLAHAFLYFARGVPVLYYGDEQGFVGSGGDKGAREDMFPSKTPSYASLATIGSQATPAADNFDVKHPLYQNLSRLAALHAAHPALRRGEYIPGPDLGPELFAFKRSLASEKDDYLLIFSLSAAKTQTIALPASSQLIYPTEAAAQPGQLSPLSFVVYKVPRSKVQPRLTLAFTNLRDKERVGKLFYGELNAPEGSIVKFSTRAEGKGKGPFKPLYEDLNPPYRAYIEGFADGTPLTIKAEVKLPNGTSQTLLQDVFIDARPPSVTVHYANSHQRTEAYTISGKGRIALPTPLSSEGIYRFAWSLDEDQQTLVFASKGKGENEMVFDQPILLNYREHILPHLQDKGAPAVTLYITPGQVPEISTKPFTEKAQAQGPVLQAMEKPPLEGRTLYVRGGMNTWQAKDSLRAVSPHTYEVAVPLSAGLTEFKFADADWSADANIGGPVTAEGLTISGGASNLSLDISPQQTGLYRLQLSFMAKGDGKPYVIARAEALKK